MFRWVVVRISCYSVALLPYAVHGFFFSLILTADGAGSFHYLILLLHACFPSDMSQGLALYVHMNARYILKLDRQISKLEWLRG